MSRAKQLIEMMCPAPATTPDRPGVKPAAPGRTAPAPRPATRPNPFRRREIRPGEAPRPKAMMPSAAPSGRMESLTEEQKKGKLKQPPNGKQPEKAYSKAKAAITTKTSVPSKGDLKKPSDGAQPQKAFKKGK